MFRLIHLKLEKHPVLGDIELNFTEGNEITNSESPYTSLIIGPNGVGKSYILRTISDIFTQFENYSITGKKEFSLPYDLKLRYFLNDNFWEIETKKGLIISEHANRPSPGYRKNYIFKVSKNYSFTPNFDKEGREVEFPIKLIVSSVIPTDRFVFKKSEVSDFYQYLGARSSNYTSNTNTKLKQAVHYLFRNSINNPKYIEDFKELLEFLEFESSITIRYKTKINSLFFSGNLEESNFRKYFEEWWAEDFPFSKRKQENPLWSIPYYNNYVKNDRERISKIIQFLNKLVKNNNHIKNIYYSPAKLLNFNLFDENLNSDDFKLIEDLSSLDIINLDGLIFKKNSKDLNSNDISSGENHILISFLGLLSTIDQNSLILIDEPEISLHPNWQMRYISFLKKVFSKYSNCHFILTSHSHFLVSDLEGESSNIIGLIKTDGRILNVDFPKNLNTFGWSAEDVLYNIFNVRSSLNYYLQADLTELLGMIANNIKNPEKIGAILEKLNALPKRENDPLQEIILEATEYLSSIQ